MEEKFIEGGYISGDYFYKDGSMISEGYFISKQDLEKYMKEYPKILKNLEHEGNFKIDKDFKLIL